MIKINKESDITFLTASVTDFADSLGYCEYKIPLSIQGVKPKPSQSLILGTKAHHAEEKYEQEHLESVVSYLDSSNQELVHTNLPEAPTHSPGTTPKTIESEVSAKFPEPPQKKIQATSDKRSDESDWLA